MAAKTRWVAQVMRVSRVVERVRMPGREVLMFRSRGSRLAAALAAVLLFGSFFGLHSTTQPPVTLAVDGAGFFSPTEKFPSSGPFVNLLSNLSSGNSLLGSTGKEEEEGEDDKELLRRAADAGMSGGGVCPRKKVAFMFLTKGRMPLRPLWELFFTGHHGCFSIYIHTSPEYTEEPPRGSVFSGRQIPSKPVRWGRASMVDAERRLLAHALLDDPCNERFVLLSESCIPLFNFTTVYRYLLRSRLSFVSSFDDPRRYGRGRYNHRMSPAVTLQDWRKGSQWFEAHRRVAAAVVADRVYYPVFRRHCRPPCYMDEHYVPTLVGKLLPWLSANRSVTWVDWSRGGSHPASFRGRQVTQRFIERARRGRTSSVGCTYNGNATTSVCFLFARKFDGSTLGPLLRLASGVLGFRV